MDFRPSPSRRTQTFFSLVDFVFLCVILAFTLLAVHGSTLISAGGAYIDSDLATYAQGMAGERDPAAFINDPVLSTRNAANSIKNLQRVLADLLTPADDVAIGLLRAGGVAIALYCLCWYIFGRFLYGNRTFAALLCCLSCITVWVGLGTFWGILHSDPVPRVFHAALFPCMLLLAVSAYENAALRPLTLFFAGLGMWLHGVSALNTGAMFFLAFLFQRPDKTTMRAHLANMFFSGLLFLLPVLVFLWPSLMQSRPFTEDELAIFRELFTIRWQEDYGNILANVLSFVSPDRTRQKNHKKSQ